MPSTPPAQAGDQPDPTSAPTVRFTVVFSDAVSDFTTGDVLVGGTAGATSAVVSGSGTTYTVTVSGMPQSGTVLAGVAAGVAHTAGGTPNSPSSNGDNTVTYTAVSPPPGVPGNLTAHAKQMTHSTEYFRYFLTQAYKNYVNRAPDESYLQQIIPQMQGGFVADEYIESLFIGAPEYIQKKGGSDAQWISSMYTDLLFRQPRADELVYWAQRLVQIRQAQAGNPNANVANVQAALEFDRSAEREGYRVQANYQAYLGRQGSAKDVTDWVNAFLLLGQTSEDLGAGFVGSAEYFQAPAKGKGAKAGWVQAAYADILHRAPGADEVNFWLDQIQ